MLRGSSDISCKCFCGQSSQLGVCGLQIRAQVTRRASTEEDSANVYSPPNPCLLPAHPPSPSLSGGSRQGHGAALKSVLPDEPSSGLSTV